MPTKLAVIPVLFILFFASACNRSTRFSSLSVSRSGVDFENTLIEDTTFNFINYLYYYNGGGVAAGDVNNDGFDDLFFTSNQNENKLYLNNGDFSFTDVTQSAGIIHQPNSWSTGVSMADVNGDGWLDIYVSHVNYLSRTGRNQLFINQQDGTFKEQAEAWGVDFEGYSVQSAFFDYDKDGDLDMYLLNHSVHSIYSYQPIESRDRVDPKSGDRLFRNDGDTFTDVSEQAGIYSSALGFGLGVTISDVNKDGWPDIYVGNDFHEDDYLYINQGDGTFAEQMRDALRHTSQFTMSVDIADINNDGQPEIATTDMLPYKENILKRSGGGDMYQVAQIKKEFGYYPQYSRNMLQLNRGMLHNNVPIFSEIGYLAGIEATDWSWSALLIDLDNDGYRDFFISNGIYRRPNDLDYIKYLSSSQVQASLQKGINPENLKLTQKMPQLKIPNAVFKNNGDYTFTDLSAEWGLGAESYSHGTTVADFDNDGDLDLAINNVNQPAFIYKNETIEQQLGGHFLQIKLEGEGKNTMGLGAKIEVFAGEHYFYTEQFPVRGFQSSISPIIHVGLGEISQIDSVRIIWPDDRFQVLKNVAPDTRLQLQQSKASGRFVYQYNEPVQLFFEDVTSELGVTFKHTENSFIDFNNERLIPHYKSTWGPPIAVADVNGDGLEDFYVGNARWIPGELWLQQPNGTFRKKETPDIKKDAYNEDTDAVFFDANGDGHPDLLVISGGGEFIGRVQNLVDRLYINDGKGNFIYSNGLPNMFTNSATVATGDFDGDGDQDVFIGGMTVPGVYGVNPVSFLLQNDGKGNFNDITDLVAPELRNVGMLSEAQWADMDGDDDLDLILAGEWMPITIYENILNEVAEADSLTPIFKNRTEDAGLGQTNGWWNTIEVTDLDGDGDLDILAGNLGLNSYLKTSPKEPVSLYLNDFNHDEKGDPVVTRFVGGQPYPYVGIDELFEQMPQLKREFSSYTQYAEKDLNAIFNKSDLDSAIVKHAYTFASMVFWNDGKGSFTAQNLPIEAQFSPIFSFYVDDVNGDGILDVFANGNFSGVRPNIGRYDASYGTLMLQTANGNFLTQPQNKVGVVLKGEIRETKPIRLGDGSQVILVSQNNDELIILKPKKS